MQLERTSLLRQAPQDALTPSTPPAYPQVASRPFTSFRVHQIGVFAAQRLLVQGFESLSSTHLSSTHFRSSEWLSTTLRPGRVLTDVVLAESGVEITVSVGMIWIPVVGPALMTNAAAIKSP
jgi:hypothetical protein